MKPTKFFTYLLTVALFVGLFYNAFIGLNVLIFNVVFIMSIVIYQPSVLKNKRAIGMMLGILILGGSVAFYCDPFSVFMNLVMLFLLPAFVWETHSNLLSAGLTSISNVLVFPYSFLTDPPLPSKKNQLLKKSLFIVVLLIVLFIFGALYTHINAEFADLICSITDFQLDALFVVTLILGAFAMYFFWYYKKFSAFDKLTPFTQNNFSKEIQENPTSLMSSAKLTTEYQLGTYIFIGVSALLSLLLFFDVKQLLFSTDIPSDISYSEYVHEGVTSVIFSILLAIVLLLIFFQGGLNFYHKKSLKTLTYIWIILNIGLLITTSLKNNLYIDTYGLTLKRLGVYGFLFLAFSGLIISILKIYYSKTNFFLIHTFVGVVLTFAVLICPINWSALITSYNYNQYQDKNLPFDAEYHYWLPEYNEHILLKIKQNSPEIPLQKMYDHRSRIFYDTTDFRDKILYYEWFLSDEEISRSHKNPTEKNIR